MTAAHAAPEWIPARLIPGSGGAQCEWVDAAGVRYTDPFFDMTLARCRRQGRARMTSTLDELRAQAEQTPRVSPIFIFHVSRCGSTLLSQLFGLDPAASVLSEVPLLDEILRSGLRDRDALFDAALRVIGRRRSGDEPRLVVKTDCWHLFNAPLLRRLYPDAPFVLLYRSPEAVLGSQHKARGSQMVPGLIANAPFTIGYDPARMTLDQYGAAVLERHYQAMLDLAAQDPHTLLVNYAEGFPAAFLRAAVWLGLSFDDEQMARIGARCGFHGKRPQETFGGDTTAALDGVDLDALQSLYDRLDARRSAAALPPGTARA